MLDDKGEFFPSEEERTKHYNFNLRSMMKFISEDPANNTRRKEGGRGGVKSSSKAGPYTSFFTLNCKPLSPEPMEGIPLHNSKMLEL